MWRVSRTGRGAVHRGNYRPGCCGCDEADNGRYNSADGSTGGTDHGFRGGRHGRPNDRHERGSRSRNDGWHHGADAAAATSG